MVWFGRWRFFFPAWGHKDSEARGWRSKAALHRGMGRATCLKYRNDQIKRDMLKMEIFYWVTKWWWFQYLSHNVQSNWEGRVVGRLRFSTLMAGIGFRNELTFPSMKRVCFNFCVTGLKPANFNWEFHYATVLDAVFIGLTWFSSYFITTFSVCRCKHIVCCMFLCCVQGSLTAASLVE